MPSPRLVLLPALVTLAACGPSSTTTTPAPTDRAAPGGTSAEVTVPDLRQRLSVVADDSMLGREAGQRGNMMVTEYLARELARLGVEPAGDNGTYFQAVPLVQRGLRDDAYLRTAMRTLQPGADYAFLAGIAGLPVAREARFDGIEVIYAGRLGDTASAVTAEQARGKFVIVAPARRAGMEERFELGAEALLEYADARVVAFANLDLAPAPLREYLSEPQTTLAGQEEVEPEAGGPALVFLTKEAATALLGRDVTRALPGATGGPVSANLVQGDTPVPFPARNVVGIVRGSDPARRGTYVAVGAHSDHVGTAHTAAMHDSLWAYDRVIRPMGAEDEPRSPTPAEATRIRALRDSLAALRPDRVDSVFNGADDDGSGTVAVLEMAEWFARADRKPARSMLFVWHTGEELGLFGADWFTRHPSVPRDSIVAQLNIDMIGRGMATDLQGGGPGYAQLIGSRRLSTELGALVERVNADGRHGFTFDYQFDAEGHPQQYYCRSDHYMYARYGIPVVFFTTGGHQDYHMLTDELAYINFDKLRAMTLLIGDIGRTVANMDHRPVVDGEVTGPEEECVQ